MWVSGSGSWRKLFGYASIPFAVYVLSPWFPGSLYIRRWKAVVSHWEKLPMLLAIYSFLKLVAFVRLFFYCYLIIDGSWADWYTQGKLKFNHFCSTWIISDYEWKNPCLYSVHTVSVVTPQHMLTENSLPRIWRYFLLPHLPPNHLTIDLHWRFRQESSPVVPGSPLLSRSTQAASF